MSTTDSSFIPQFFDTIPPYELGKKKKLKKKCCEKYKRKGKHCKNCPLKFKLQYQPSSSFVPLQVYSTQGV